MSRQHPTTDPRHTEYLPLDEIRHADRNPKRHDIGALRRAIARFGFVASPVLDERTGQLVAGHGRLEALVAMRDDGETPPAGVRLTDAGTWLVPVLRGWASRSDAEADAYLLTDNRLTEVGGWDDTALGELLADINSIDPELATITGFDATHLPPAADPSTAGNGDASDSNEPDAGELLTLAGTTVGEPDYQTAPGEVWHLDRHVLVITSPHNGWHRFVPYLEAGSILLPYPSTLAPLADVAPGARLVMVQPNTYLAGWTLTRWARVTGQEPTKEVTE